MKIKSISIPWKKIPIPHMSLKKEKQGDILIELSDRFLKIVQVIEENAQRKIAYFKAVELDVADEKKLSATLSELLKELPHRVGRVFASIPRSQITTRILVLPSTQPTELAKMVDFQVEKEIPFPKEKIVFDNYPIEITEEGYSRLLLVIAGREVIQRYLNILKGSKLFPDALFFSSQGLVSWYKMLQREKDEDAFVALVDIDHFMTHVEIIRRGKLYFTRSFMIGAKQLSGQAAQEAFLQELNRTFVAFKKEMTSEAMTKIVLTGIASIATQLEQLIGTRWSIPVESVDFGEHCPMADALKEQALQMNVSFSSSVGFLIKPEKRINLLPRAEKRARRDRMIRRSAVQFAVLVIGILALLGFMVGNSIHRQQKALSRLTERLQQLEPTALKIEMMEKQLSALELRDQKADIILEILRELYQIVPENAFLTYLIIDSERVSLRGRSNNLATVLEFAKSLESSSFFDSVRLKNATRRSLSEGEVTLFQIDSTVKFSEETF